MPTRSKPLIGIIMGSDSDLLTMREAAAICAEFDVPHEIRIVSAHRTPRFMARYAGTARSRGIKIIIAGAGGAAHLPGMIASLTELPVIGVPVKTKALDGLDSLLSIAQMPAGIPVATVAIGNARNAGLLAIQILALASPPLRKRLAAYRQGMTRLSRAKDSRLARSKGKA